MSAQPGQTLLERFELLSEPIGPYQFARDAQGGQNVLLIRAPVAGKGTALQPLMERAARFAIGARGLCRALVAEWAGDELVVAYAVAGTTAAEQQLEQGALHPPRVAAVGRALGEALAALHDQGVAHGHISAGTTLLSPEVALAGYGVWSLVDSLAGPGAAAGVLPEVYRAPEQRALMPSRAEPWSDVYSLAVVLSELIAGRSASGVSEPTPRALGVQVSESIERLFAAALDSKPSARPKNIALWTEQLARELEVLPALPLPPLAAPSDAEAAPDTARLDTFASAPGAGPAPWAEPPRAEHAAPPAPAPQPKTEPSRQAAPAAGPRAPAPFPPPHLEDTGKEGASWSLLAVMAGLFLMVVGVGATFSYAMLRPSTPSTPATASADAGVAIPLPPPPVVPGLDPDAGSSEVEEDEESGDAGLPSSPELPQPLPSGQQRFSSTDHGSPLPVDAAQPIWGSENAQVTVVVFGDFECPHTRKTLGLLGRMKKLYKDELRLVWRHRPLPQYRVSRDAARLGVALFREHGDAAFWKYALQAAAHPANVDNDDLKTWAVQAGGARDRVDGWKADPSTAREVDADLALAAQFSVRATPTLFINGLRFQGYQPLSELRRQISAELSAARSALASGVKQTELYASRVRKNLINLGDDVPDRRCPKIDDAPARGASDALVTIVEFSDFQCPFCKRVQPTLETLLARHPGDVKLVWKNQPLAFHTRARPAALFALEAFQRGGASKFWRVHDLLFEKQDDLSDARFGSIAGGAGLEQSSMLEAVRTEKHAGQLAADISEAKSLEVSGTPTFFVNGRRISGAQPLSVFDALVSREVDGAKRLLEGGVARDRVYDAVCGKR